MSKFFTVNISYDDYKNEQLNTITVFDNDKTSFIEDNDTSLVTTTMSINDLINNGYTVRGY